MEYASFFCASLQLLLLLTLFIPASGSLTCRQCIDLIYPGGARPRKPFPKWTHNISKAHDVRCWDYSVITRECSSGCSVTGIRDILTTVFDDDGSKETQALQKLQFLGIDTAVFRSCADSISAVFNHDRPCTSLSRGGMVGISCVCNLPLCNSDSIELLFDHHLTASRRPEPLRHNFKSHLPFYSGGASLDGHQGHEMSKTAKTQVNQRHVNKHPHGRWNRKDGKLAFANSSVRLKNWHRDRPRTSAVGLDLSFGNYLTIFLHYVTFCWFIVLVS